jgi:hypothetical protein
LSLFGTGCLIQSVVGITNIFIVQSSFSIFICLSCDAHP